METHREKWRMGLLSFACVLFVTVLRPGTANGRNTAASFTRDDGRDVSQIAVFMGAARPASERHDDCVGATNGGLGEVVLRNNCRAQVDLKYCYMRQDGGDVNCRFAAPLNPGFQVSTPQCYQCAYKVVWEAFLTSDHARGEFSSNEEMITRLRG